MNFLSNSQWIELIIGIIILVCGIAYIVSETIISTLEATKAAASAWILPRVPWTWHQDVQDR
jgi:hypothetical protein